METTTIGVLTPYGKKWCTINKTQEFGIAA